MDLNERVARVLEAHGVKATPQRLAIGRLMLAEPCHLSAEQIIAALRAADSRISKATVYNTLNLFCSHGILRAVAVDPNRLVYDSTTTPHHHFFNEDTGELIDIEPQGLRIQGLPALPDGTDARSVELVVRVRNRED